MRMICEFIINFAIYKKNYKKATNIRIMSRRLVALNNIKLFLICLISWNAIALNVDNNNTTCLLNYTISCDGKPPCPQNSTTIITGNQTVYDCDVPLILTAQYVQIQGSFTNLAVNCQIAAIGDVSILQNLTIYYTNESLIQGVISVGGTIFINIDQSNKTDVFQPFKQSQKVDKTKIAISNSNIGAKQILLQAQQLVYINNSLISTFGQICFYNQINLQTFSESILQYNNTAFNLTQLGQLSISVAFASEGDIVIQNSIIQTTVITIFTNSNLTIMNSQVNTSAKACRTNMGSGRGLVVQLQNQYCTSGSSSSGYGLISNQSCSSILQYFMFLTHSFPYMSKGPFLGTGSGGYGYEAFSNTQKGAGGGIIFIFVKKLITLDTTFLTASGGDVYIQDPLSAGSGGTVFIYSNIIEGFHTNVSVSGGSSYNGRGAGSGGMVKISYQTPYGLPHGSIWIDVSEGNQSNSSNQYLFANGIFYGPMCSQGSFRWYIGCLTCVPGTYNTIGNQLCLTCPTSQYFQLNTQSIANQNVWNCFLNSRNYVYSFWIIPGSIDLLTIGLYIGFLLVFSIIGLFLKRRIRKDKIKSSQDQFSFQALQKDLEQAKILTEKLKKDKCIKPYELMYHIHRITVAGSNTDLCPWVLPLAPPDIIKKYVLCGAFSVFAKKFNKIAKWSKFQMYFTKFLYLIYPLHWLYYDRIKKQKYSKLSVLLEQSKQYNLINNYDFQDKDLITIKFSKNKDYTSCYIDFFLYQKADLSYYNLSTPFIVYLSGQGNFIRPFYLEQNDPFLNALVFIVNRNIQKNEEKIYQQKVDRLDLFGNLVSENKRKKNLDSVFKFVRKFNSISCTLDLSSPINNFIQTLSILIDFINNWNKNFYNRLTVQIDLILMISDLHEQNIVSSSVHILSNKNDEFLQKIKQIIPRMNLNSDIDLKIGLFIYNPEQEMVNFAQKSSQKLVQNLLSGDLGQSQQDNDNDSIGQPLLQEQREEQSKNKPKKDKSKKKRVRSSLPGRFTRFFLLFRYYMFSHQLTKNDKYTIKVFQSFVILTQTALVFLWSIKLEIPYVFVNLIAPFVGIIWFVSDSYGFGKLYLILNAMNLFNQLITLLVYSLILQNSKQALLKIGFCQVINIVLVILAMIVGCRYITFSKKLTY